MNNRINPTKRVYDELVSIVFIAEGNPDYAFPIFRNLTQQIYKKVEYIVVHHPDFDVEEFKKLVDENTPVDISTPLQYVTSIPKKDLFALGIEHVNGNIIFLKATNNTLWYPNHILTHLERHKEGKFQNSIVLSQVDYRNPRIILESPVGALGFRNKKKINVESLLLDEISFTKDVPLDFNLYSAKVNQQGKVVSDAEDGRIVFDIKKLYYDMVLKCKNIKVAEEISLVMFMQQQDPDKPLILTQPNWSQLATIQSVTDDLEVVHRLPTLFGNTQLDELWNNKIREWLRTYWDSIIARKDRRIIIKRSIGMGDVLCTEPVVRYFKEQGFEVWYVTSNSRSCKLIVEQFESRPDKILTIDESEAMADWLGETKLLELGQKHDVKIPDFDIRLDLDIAYESRPGKRFVDAYFETLGFAKEVVDGIDLRPRLATRPLEMSIKFLGSIAVCLDGSGWQSKELNTEDTRNILLALKEKGYKLVHTNAFLANPDGSKNRFAGLESLFDEVNSSNDFHVMLQMIFNSKGYVGSDNGPMHVALAYGKECFIWNGAALTNVTSAATTVTTLVKDLACIGCKHKMFFDILQFQNGQRQLTFVPQCTNSNKFECTDTFDSKKLESKIEEFENKLAQVVVPAKE